jgi:preprotein translocase subunit YajC
MQGGSFFASIMPLMIMVVIFYFLIIRPQQKQAKDHKAMVDGLTKGDKIITSGGIIAIVVKAEEEFLKVEITDGTFVKLSKDYIAKKVD